MDFFTETLRNCDSNSHCEQEYNFKQRYTTSLACSNRRPWMIISTNKNEMCKALCRLINLSDTVIHVAFIGIPIGNTFASLVVDARYT